MNNGELANSTMFHLNQHEKKSRKTRCYVGS